MFVIFCLFSIVSIRYVFPFSKLSDLNVADFNSATAFIYFFLFCSLALLNVYFFHILIRWTLPMVKQEKELYKQHVK